MANNKNRFGGYWTEEKIEIFIKYVKAYLEIMKSRNFQLTYFDGFAGSGYIEQKGKSSIEGVAIKVLGISEPREFDIYYLVELNKRRCSSLQKRVKDLFPKKESKTYVIQVDCNEKIVRLANYLKQDASRRALIFLDPKGMQVDLPILECLKGLGVDLWILVPTGLGVNRLLTKSGNISQKFMKKLSSFLGMTDSEIKNYFYKVETEITLFGEETKLTKDEQVNDRAIELIREKIGNIFKFVSKPFPMKNTRNSLMFHFVYASNNKAGLKIANDIIGKQLRNSII